MPVAGLKDAYYSPQSAKQIKREIKEKTKLLRDVQKENRRLKKEHAEKLTRERAAVKREDDALNMLQEIVNDPAATDGDKTRAAGLILSEN